MCTRQKTIKYIEEYFFPLVIRVFAELYKTFFCVHCLFSSQENNGQQSVARKLKTRQNKAGGDTAQITDFAQTWHKCWVWGANDYGKNLG